MWGLTQREGQEDLLRADRQWVGVDRSPMRAAIVTRSGSESAFILRMTWPLCAFTVISLMPSSPPTCLFNRPGDDQCHHLSFARGE